jgi:hypothetical protein
VSTVLLWVTKEMTVKYAVARMPVFVPEVEEDILSDSLANLI